MLAERVRGVWALGGCCLAELVREGVALGELLGRRMVEELGVALNSSREGNTPDSLGFVVLRARWKILALASVAIGLAGLGASMISAVSPLLGWALMILGILALLGTLFWAIWPFLTSHFRETHSIEVTPDLVDLSEPRNDGRYLINVALLHPKYLCLAVKNQGTRVLSRVVAKVRLVAPDKRELKDYAAWSAEPGNKFVRTGPAEVDISAGSERVAVAAVAYEGFLLSWFKIDRTNVSASAHFGPGVSQEIEETNPDSIGPTCMAEVTVQADGCRPVVKRLKLHIREKAKALGEAKFEELDRS